MDIPFDRGERSVLGDRVIFGSGVDISYTLGSNFCIFNSSNRFIRCSHRHLDHSHHKSVTIHPTTNLRHARDLSTLIIPNDPRLPPIRTLCLYLDSQQIDRRLSIKPLI